MDESKVIKVRAIFPTSCPFYVQSGIRESHMIPNRNNRKWKSIES